MKKNKKRSIVCILALSLLLSQGFPAFGLGGDKTIEAHAATAETFSKTAPKVTVKKRTYSSLSLSWTKVEGASGYEVYRSTSAKGKYTRVARVTATSYKNTSLKTNKAYYYKVKAYQRVGSKRTYGRYSSYKRGVPTPATPSKVTAPIYSALKIKITWNATASISGYEVYRATTSKGKYIRKQTTKSKSYFDSAITTGKTYYYKVRAYKVIRGKRVYGIFSTPIAAKAIPSAPKVKVSIVDTNKTQIAWKKIIGASGYEIQRGTAIDGEFSTLADTSKTEFADTKVTAGQTYYYKVIAYRIVKGKKIFGYTSELKFVTFPPNPDDPGTDKPTPDDPGIGGGGGGGTTPDVPGGGGGGGTTPDVPGGGGGGTTPDVPGGGGGGTTPDVPGGGGGGTTPDVPDTDVTDLGKVGLVATESINATTIKLTWAPVPQVTGYEVYRATVENGEYTKIGETITAEYESTGLTAGEKNFYKVRAYREVGGERAYGEDSKPVSETTVAERPVVTATIVEGTKIKLTWTGINGAGLYRVHRTTSPGGEYVQLGNPTSSLTYTDAEEVLKNGGTYYYAVSIATSQGSGFYEYTNFSEQVAATLTIGKAELKARAVDATTIELSWEPVIGAEGYKITRSTTSNGPYTDLSSTTGTTVKDSGLTPGQEYYYKVTAYSGSVEGSSSDPVSATPVIPKVSSPRVTVTDDTKLNLRWNKISGATGYEIHQSTTLDGQYSVIKSTTEENTVIESLTKDQTYYYKVKAYNDTSGAKIYGDFSEVVAGHPAELSMNIQEPNVKTAHQISLGLQFNKTAYVSFEYFVSINGAEFQSIGTTNSTGRRNYTVEHGKKYKFKVRGASNGSYSAEVSYECQWEHHQSEKTYTVGDGADKIPAGVYYFQLEPKASNVLSGDYTIENTTNDDADDDFFFERVDTSRYQELRDGDKLIVTDLRMIPVEKAPLLDFDPNGEINVNGMYLVGRDIPEGYYSAKGTDSGIAGTYLLKDNIRRTGAVYNLIFVGNNDVADVQYRSGDQYLKAGSTVEISGVSLIYKGATD